MNMAVFVLVAMLSVGTNYPGFPNSSRCIHVRGFSALSVVHERSEVGGVMVTRTVLCRRPEFRW